MNITDAVNISETEQIINLLTNNNALLNVLLSLVGIIAICSIIRLCMSLYSKIKNKKRNCIK